MPEQGLTGLNRYNSRANNRPKPLYDFNQNYAKDNIGTNDAFSIAPYLFATFTASFFENQIKGECDDFPKSDNNPPERQENDIQTFSKNSRRRLFDLFTSLQYSTYGEPVFVSATWHYDAPDSRAEIKTVLHNYYQRLRRELPQFLLIWKLEYQIREVPHFHFMIFPNDQKKSFQNEKTKSIIKHHWLSLKNCKCHSCNDWAIHIREVKEYGHALIYISKEIAKLQDRYQSHNLGRVWGKYGNVRNEPLHKITCTVKDWIEFCTSIQKSNSMNENNWLYIQGIKQIPRNSKIWFSKKDIETEIVDLQKSVEHRASQQYQKELKQIRLNFNPERKYKK